MKTNDKIIKKRGDYQMNNSPYTPQKIPTIDKTEKEEAALIVIKTLLKSNASLSDIQHLSGKSQQFIKKVAQDLEKTKKQ